MTRFFQGHHRHSSNQPRSSSHQRSSNSSSSSASAAPRNSSFDPNFYRSKAGAPNHHPKSVTSSLKKKSGGAIGGQNHHYSNKNFGHNQHGNVGNNNLRVPPQSSNKMPAGAQVNMHSGKVSKEYGVNNNSKGKVTTMKAPPSHYVVVQRHGQNMENHRHQSKQSPK